MSNPLAGKRGVWLRRFGDTGEKTLPAILAQLKDHGFDLLCLEVAYGVTFTGTFDSYTPVTNIVSLQQLTAACADAGITLAPVVLPRGFTNQGEAELHAQIASTCGTVIVDIEQGKDYWDQSPLNLIPAYFKTLRVTTNAYICAQPDPRPGATAAIPLGWMAPYVDAFAGQHYVGYDTNWRDVGTEALRVDAIKALGRDTYVTLWGLGDLAAAGAFWQAVQPDVLGFQVFAFGSMNETQLAWAAGLPDPVQPTPPKPAWTNDDLVEMGRLLYRLDAAGNPDPDWAGARDYAGSKV